MYPRKAPPAHSRTPSSAWRGRGGLHCCAALELVCESRVLLAAYLAVGKFDSAEARVLALLVGALLPVVALAECLVAVLGCEVVHCQRGLRAIRGLSDCRDDALLSLIPLFPQAFASFAEQRGSLGSGLKQCVHVGSYLGHLMQSLIQAPAFSMERRELGPDFAVCLQPFVGAHCSQAGVGRKAPRCQVVDALVEGTKDAQMRTRKLQWRC